MKAILLSMPDYLSLTFYERGTIHKILKKSYHDFFNYFPDEKKRLYSRVGTISNPIPLAEKCHLHSSQIFWRSLVPAKQTGHIFLTQLHLLSGGLPVPAVTALPGLTF